MTLFFLYLSPVQILDRIRQRVRNKKGDGRGVARKQDEKKLEAFSNMITSSPTLIDPWLC